MCNALDKVEESEWEAQVRKVDSLIAWKNWMMGAIATIGGITALGLLLLNHSINNKDESTKELVTSVSKLVTEFAVFRQEVKPFLNESDRFTEKDYEKNIKADLAAFYDRLPTKAVTTQLDALDKSDDFILRRLDSQERRLDEIEKANSRNHGP